MADWEADGPQLQHSLIKILMGIRDDAREADCTVLRERKVKNVITGHNEVQPFHEP